METLFGIFKRCMVTVLTDISFKGVYEHGLMDFWHVLQTEIVCIFVFQIPLVTLQVNTYKSFGETS